MIAIARGLDMPVEYLTGVGAINHWGQWFIEDQLWKSPLAAVSRGVLSGVDGDLPAPLDGGSGVDDLV